MDSRWAFLLSHDEQRLREYSVDELNKTCDITSANPNNYPKLFCREFGLAGLPIDQFLNAITK